MRIGVEGEIPTHWFALIRGEFEPISILENHPPVADSDNLGARERSDWLRKNVLPQILVVWSSNEDCNAELESYLDWDMKASPGCEEWHLFTFPGSRPIEHRTVSRSVGELETLDYHHPWWDFLDALNENKLERESHHSRIQQ